MRGGLLDRLDRLDLVRCEEVKPLRSWYRLGAMGNTEIS